jgi:alkanesulfonate monooxygenase SsuD/methylene tetrahydromethanopterin reductase-like flavin-dependent oxidoreductase (luciferase family)
MRHGLMLPYMTRTTRAGLLGWAIGAEDAGFATVTVGERMTYPNLAQNVAMAAAAAVTSRVRLLANITILPMHPAGLLAKELASLDVISEGRFVMAAGVGDREQDYRAAEATMEWRWPRADEKIRQMQRIWAGEPLEAGHAPIGPAPFTPGGPQLWIGSRGPRALARAALWGATGYAGFVTNGDRQQLTDQRDAVLQTWTDAGRADRPYLFVSCFVALGPGAEDRMRQTATAYWAGWAAPEMRDAIVAQLTCTSESAVHSLLDTAEDVGFDEVNLLPMTDDLAELERFQKVVADRA